MLRLAHSRGLLLLISCTLCSTAHAAPQLKLALPLGRFAYQTNETIDLTAIRSDSAPLPAGKLALSVSGTDGSQMRFVFPIEAIPPHNGTARDAQHLHLNGRLLRPGKYSIEVSADGASAKTDIEVYTHIPRSSFKEIDWSSTAKDQEQALIGEDSMGFNLMYAAYGGLNRDQVIRGRCDFMWCCTMSGGHQMDLRQECDWSDPYVLQGGEARVVRRALEDRTMPNCLGVHFYDEPGLTWWKDPRTGVMSPFNIPSQDRSYRSAFGKEPPHYYDVKPDDAAAVARWKQMNRWKLQFMPAAWKYAQFGVSEVRPDFLSVTQSVYGESAYADGYYFNVVRPLAVISGHGGYSDWGPGYFNPVWTLDMGRIRELDKPTWYLPEWGALPSVQYRLSQYLSFMTDIQGLAKPPDIHIQSPAGSPAAEAVVEANKLTSRLGTIFTALPPKRPPVAMLYSLTQDLHAEIRDMQDARDLNKAAYTGGGHSRDKTFLAWMAAQRIHQRLMPIVEEDILDGTLAAHHKVLLIPGVDELPPNVISALQGYIKGGGVVLLSDDSKVQIPGATRLGVPIDNSFMDKIQELYQQKNEAELKRLDVTGNYTQAAVPVADALARHLSELGIHPDLDADSPQIITSAQGEGDIEYLFAANATYDPAGGQRNSLKAAVATLTTADDGRMIYDAIRGGAATEFKSLDKRLSAKIRFGPGELRAFARTTRPIGAVQITPPLLRREYTDENNPSSIQFTVSILDNQHAILSGAAPVQVQVIDPLGMLRHDLYRATNHGTLQLNLPIASNDPAGNWTIKATELLGNTVCLAQFTYQPPSQAGALAGRTHRAVVFGNDADNIFRMFRMFHEVSIVVGSSPFDAAGAQRIIESLKPWDIECKVVKAADVNHGRGIDAAAAPTWAGLDPGKAEPGGKNPPSVVGFDLRGPAILLGNPDDNPLIKFAADKKFLPYAPHAADMPGPGRGYLAWQRDAVGMGQESVTLIAYDEDGMNQTIGSFYEAVAGLEPLMKYEPPAEADVTAASKSTLVAPPAKIAWRAILPDRATSIQISGDSLKIATLDGSISTIDSSGKISATQEVAAPDLAIPTAPKIPEALQKNLAPMRIPKHVVAGGSMTAIGYWGGTVQLFDGTSLKTQQLLPQDIAAMAWLGDKLIVALSDGQVLALESK